MKEINFDTIEKFSYGYALLKKTVNFFHNKIYYRKVIALNADKIDFTKPVIFAPNHQNALMDAMSVLCTLGNKQIVFLARADIFKKPAIAKILRFMKIMPVFRVRDGADQLHKNEAVFQRSIRVIKSNAPFVIMPEGNHAGFRRLRQLKKGLTRIVFPAEEANDFSLGVQIVPVGLEYGDYEKPQSTLIVNYGEAIDCTKYKELYSTNPNLATTQFLHDIREKLVPLIIHIENETYYDTFDKIRKLYCKKMLEQLGLENTLANAFVAEQKIIASLDQYLKEPDNQMIEFSKWVETYKLLMNQLKLRDWVLEKEKYSHLLMELVGLAGVITFPFFLYGAINNYFPFYFPKWFVNRNVNDKQFHSSVKFVLGLFLFPLFHLIQTAIVTIISSSVLIGLGYLISLPLTGWFAFKYFIQSKKIRAKLRYNRLLRNNNKHLLTAIDLRRKIFGFMDDITLNSTTEKQ